MADITALIPQQPLVTSEAPTPKIGSQALNDAFGGAAARQVSIAPGLAALGQGLDDLGGQVGAQEGRDAVAKAVTRNPDGSLNVATPQDNIALGQGGAAYQHAVEAGTLAALSTKAQTDINDLALKNQGNPAGFQKDASDYVTGLGSRFGDGPLGASITAEAQRVSGQTYNGMVDAKAKSDLNTSKQNVLTQIDDSKNSMLALARQGGTDTPEFQQQQAKVDGFYDQLGKNPLFGYSPEQIASEKARFHSEMMFQGIVGGVDRYKAQYGVDATAKHLQEDILNNPNSPLSDSERKQAYSWGMARLNYQTEQQKADAAGAEAGSRAMVALYQAGHPPADDQFDAVVANLRNTGSVEALSQLQAAREAATAYRSISSLSPAGQQSAIMGTEGAQSATEQTALSYLMGKGWTQPQAAGILGHLIYESGGKLNPNARAVGDGQDGSDSIGIGQWNGDRAKALMAFAASRGKPWNDLQTQLDFADRELNSSEISAGTALRAAKTPQDAAVAALGYERPQGYQPGADPSLAAGWSQRLANVERLAGGGAAGTSEDSGMTADQIFRRNASWVAPGATNFNTQLSSSDEQKFRQWVSSNHVQFDPNQATPDYDMRGFWQALQNGDPKAKSAVDPNDGKMHFPDYWKTPYDFTFSRESKYANANAPHWTDDDKLVSSGGQVLFDDRAPKGVKSSVTASNSPIPFTPDQIRANPYLVSASVSQFKINTQAQVQWAKNQGASLVNMIKGGVMPSAPQIASVLQIASANPKELGDLQGQIESLVKASPIAAQSVGAPNGQAVLDQAYDYARKNPSIASFQQAKALQDQFASRQKALASDPHAYAARPDVGWIPRAPIPLDPTDPNKLAQGIVERRAAADAIASRTGQAPESVTFTKPDIQTMSKFMASMPAKDIGTLLTGLTHGLTDKEQEALEDDKTFSGSISGMARSGDPGKMSLAFGYMRQLYEKNPISFEKDFGGDVVAKMKTFEDKWQFMPPDQAMKAVMQVDDPSSARARDELRAQAITATKSVGVNDILGGFGGAKLLGIGIPFTKPGAPVTDASDLGAGSAAMLGDYKSAYADGFVTSGGDKSIAQNLAVEKISKKWGASPSNGGRVMAYPPERYYPQVNGSHDWMTKQLDDDVRETIASTNPEGSFNFSPDPLGLKGILPGNSSVTPPRALVSDAQTTSEIAAGQPPSYRVVVQDKTGQFHLLEQSPGKPMRFRFDPAPAQKAAEATFTAAHSAESAYKHSAAFGGATK